MAGTLAQVAVAAADLAQPEAIGPAQRRERHLEHHRVAHDRLGVQRQVRRERVVVVGTRVARDELGHLHVEVAFERLEASGASHREPPLERTPDVDALDHALERQLGGDRGVLGHVGELGPKAGDRLLHADGPRGPRGLEEISDVDRSHHASSSSVSSDRVSSGPSSALGVAPRSFSRPATTWSIVRESPSLDAIISSRIFCSVPSSCASFAST